MKREETTQNCQIVIFLAGKSLTQFSSEVSSESRISLFFEEISALDGGFGVRKMINQLTAEDCRKLVGIGLMTDGSVKIKKCRKDVLSICYYNKDRSMHHAFQQLFKRGYNKNFRALVKGIRVYWSVYEVSSKGKVGTKLLKYSPTYNTSGKIDNTPTINFIISTTKRLVGELAVRFAMSNDGCISICHGHLPKSIVRLKFACAHPGLVQEWKELFHSVGISLWIDKDNRMWAGIHGLCGGLEAVRNFHNIGGFWPNDVRTSRGNFIGIPKNTVLDKSVRWLANRRTGTLDEKIKNGATVI